MQTAVFSDTNSGRSERMEEYSLCLRSVSLELANAKQPHYRVIVADARKARNGRHVDILGHYNPRTEPSTVQIDTERAQEWLQKGAQPTDRARKLLKIAGLEA